jgi:hypothetical protein
MDMKDIVANIVISIHRAAATAMVTGFVLLLPVVGQTAQPGTQVGMLACQMSPRIDPTVESVQPIKCRFIPDGGYPERAYVGEIDTVGSEVGITTDGVLVWDVFTPTGGREGEGLVGVYAGASGNNSLGDGGSANVLFGGSNQTIALLPVALEGEVALGWGIAGLRLAAVS